MNTEWKCRVEDDEIFSSDIFFRLMRKNRANFPIDTLRIKVEELFYQYTDLDLNMSLDRVH